MNYEVNRSKCDIKKRFFSKSSKVNSIINKINGEESKEQILSYLELLFLKLKELAMDADFRPEKKLGVSHSKIVFLEEEISHGTLKFESMHFTGLYFTGVHIHPEYIVDEVIEGRLQERLYTSDFNGNFRYKEEYFRGSNDRRVSCDGSGRPHNVKGCSGGGLSFCLTLGKQKVEFISLEKILND